MVKAGRVEDLLEEAGAEGQRCAIQVLGLSISGCGGVSAVEERAGAEEAGVNEAHWSEVARRVGGVRW